MTKRDHNVLCLIISFQAVVLFYEALTHLIYIDNNYFKIKNEKKLWIIMVTQQIANPP